MPVISGLTYTKTDTTIVAVWTTDVSSDSNLFAGSKAAIDNGVAASGTSHQCIVTGLLPSTTYSCHVVSGGTSSAVSNVTTNALQTRVLITSAKQGAVTLGNPSNNYSDTQRTFLSSDGKVYITQDDATGIVAGTPNAGYNTQVAALSDEVAMTGGSTLLTTYGGANTTNGTDGPGGVAMTNKSSGLFGLNANLHMFVYRQLVGSSNRYCNWIKTTNHGTTWNNFTATSTFVSGGNPVTPNSPAEPVQFYVNTIGLVNPVLYAADDGTLGYNTSGNQIDGGNAFVYMTYLKDNDLTTLWMMRLPRIQFDAQNAAPMQYWAGPTYPGALDFTNDSNWSSSSSAAVNIKPSFPLSANLNGSVWYQPVFIPAINSYALFTTGYYNGNTVSPNGIISMVYSAPTPAGPWQLFYTKANTAASEWWSGFFPFHRDIAGNAATSNITSKVLFSGGTALNHYCINYSTFTMLPSSGAEKIQLVQYPFSTVENPLSFNGNFSNQPGGYLNLNVPSAGVCETTVNSGNSVMLWTGPIPSGDTGGTWPADQYCELTVGLLNNHATNNQYLTVRASAVANSFYLLQVAAETTSPVSVTQTLSVFVAGTNHALTTVAATISAGDVIRLDITGNVLTISQNGTVLTTFTDTNNYLTSGAPGIGCLASTATANQIANWAAGANQAAPPTFSPVGGAYSGTQTVTITGPASSTIYYTTDGTTPTRSSPSFPTGGTVTVSSTKTIKAISSVSNFADSSIAGATFNLTSKVKTTHQQLRNWREGRR